MQSEEKIHYKNAPVKYVENAKGWVAKDGRFWGENEHMARWTSCDVLDCATEKCNNTVDVRSSTFCDSCSENKRIEKFEALERKEWDGSTPLYSDSCDTYFFCLASLNGYMEENDVTVNDLQLVICEPIHMRQFDECSLLDDLHEDAEIPVAVSDAAEALNKAIREHGQAMSWTPSKYAAVISHKRT